MGAEDSVYNEYFCMKLAGLCALNVPEVQIEMFVRFHDGLLEDIRFLGRGCAVSQAGASLLTEAVKGKGRGVVKAMDREKMQELVGIRVTPTRARCMMLPLKVLKTVVYLHEGRKLEEQEAWNEATMRSWI